MSAELDVYQYFDETLFSSGCSKHWINLPDVSGYIIPEENLIKFAELLVQKLQTEGKIIVV